MDDRNLGCDKETACMITNLLEITRSLNDL